MSSLPFSIILTNHLVKFNQKSVTKQEAITAVGKLLVANNLVSEPYIKAMHLRDQDVSVYLGNDVAIPHGTNDSKKYIKNSGIALIIYPDGINWDNNNVYIVIGLAGQGDAHMQLISQLGIVLSNYDNITKIVQANSVKQLEDILNQNE